MINVITYDFPHRKTQDLLFRLLAKNYKNIAVFSTPWVERKSFVPFIPHRPFEFHKNATINIYPEELSRKLGFDYFKLNSENIVKKIKTKL